MKEMSLNDNVFLLGLWLNFVKIDLCNLSLRWLSSFAFAYFFDKSVRSLSNKTNARQRVLEKTLWQCITSTTNHHLPSYQWLSTSIHSNFTDYFTRKSTVSIEEKSLNWLFPKWNRHWPSTKFQLNIHRIFIQRRSNFSLYSTNIRSSSWPREEILHGNFLFYLTWTGQMTFLQLRKRKFSKRWKSLLSWRWSLKRIPIVALKCQSNGVREEFCIGIFNFDCVKRFDVWSLWREELCLGVCVHRLINQTHIDEEKPVETLPVFVKHLFD